MEEAPEISTGFATLGRETLHAIEEELEAERRKNLPVRPGRRTLNDLAEAIAPGQAAKLAPPKRPERRTIGFEEAQSSPAATAGGHLRAPTPPPPVEVEPIELLETLTVALRGVTAAHLADAAARDRIVRERILPRYPDIDPKRLAHVEIIPGPLRMTVLVRLWILV